MNASSKILLVCGFCISFGIYTSSIQEANWKVVDVGQQRSYYTQARMISNAGLFQAMYSMANPIWFRDNKDFHTGMYSSPVIPVGDGSLWYTIDKMGLPSSQACVTVTAKLNGVVARQRVIIVQSSLPSDPGYLSANRMVYDPVTANYFPYCTWKVKQAYFYPYMLTESERSPNSI